MHNLNRVTGKKLTLSLFVLEFVIIALNGMLSFCGSHHPFGKQAIT